MALRAFLLVALLLAAALLLPSAVRAQTVLPLDRSTEVREHAGIAMFSRWDGSAYRLAVYRDGVLADLPQVPPQATRFDFDIGSNSKGEPQAIISRCVGSCDLYVLDLEPGAELRPVRNANTRGHDERAPTVWRGRIAFARRYADEDVPYTKELIAPRSRPSDRLAQLPNDRCIAIDPPTCRAVEDARVSSLELWGRWVGQTWTYSVDSSPGFAQNEVRLTTVDRTDTRQVQFFTSGLGAQGATATSFADGAMAWYLTCFGDPGGCTTRGLGGAYRYRISSGDYARAFDSSQLLGWAWNGELQWRSLSTESLGGCEPNPPQPPAERICPLTITIEPDFERIEAPEPQR